MFFPIGTETLGETIFTLPMSPGPYRQGKRVRKGSDFAENLTTQTHGRWGKPFSGKCWKHPTISGEGTDIEGHDDGNTYLFIIQVVMNRWITRVTLLWISPAANMAARLTIFSRYQWPIPPVFPTDFLCRWFWQKLMSRAGKLAKMTKFPHGRHRSMKSHKLQ